MQNLWRFGVVLGSVLVSNLLAACSVSDPASEGPISEVHQATFGEEFNGRQVLGTVLDGLAPASSLVRTPARYFSVQNKGVRNGNAQDVWLIGGASLLSQGKDGTFSGDDAGFNDLVLFEGVPPARKIRLKNARGRGITHYSLDLQSGTDPFTRVCDDAIPLTGVIEWTGEHVEQLDRVTFACADGAVNECVRYGYPPGLRHSQFWGAHQACVQMLNARYCADGEPNTRDGTTIAFYDNVGIHQIQPGTPLPTITAAQWPPNTTDYYFEAAFRGDFTDAVCRGKLRWPRLTDTCVAAIPDCAERTIGSLIDPGDAVMFVASTYNQLRFDRWRHGTDRVVTIRGYHDDSTGQLQAPWDGYIYEGTDGILMRIPPTSVPESERAKVSLYRNGATDYFVARNDDDRFARSPFSVIAEEGYVYEHQWGPTFVPLRLYLNPMTHDFTTTTATLEVMADLGYLPQPDAGHSLIGWIAPGG